ncbi:MAG: hypothetical protein QM500_14745 [Methylococcales bacterium]
MFNKLILIITLSFISIANASFASSFKSEGLMIMNGVSAEEVKRFSIMSVRMFTDISYKSLASSAKNIQRISTRQLSGAYIKQFSKKSVFYKKIQSTKKSTKAISVGRIYEHKEKRVHTVLIPVNLESKSISGKQITKKVAKMAIVKTRYGLRVASFTFLL